jgi:hypothetical protein
MFDSNNAKDMQYAMLREENVEEMMMLMMTQSITSTTPCALRPIYNRCMHEISNSKESTARP